MIVIDTSTNSVPNMKYKQKVATLSFPKYAASEYKIDSAMFISENTSRQ